MSYFPDLGTNSQVVTGNHVRAIGWLHPDYPHATGSASLEFVDRLKPFAEKCGASAHALYFGASGGLHRCEFCGKAWGSCNFGVPHGSVLYVAPEMVAHYVECHGYCPPNEFIEAVLRCPMPDTQEYQVLTEPYWHLHKETVEQIAFLQSSK